MFLYGKQSSFGCFTFSLQIPNWVFCVLHKYKSILMKPSLLPKGPKNLILFFQLSQELLKSKKFTG